MDINEIDLPMKYRHPWERSRTDCLLWELRPFLDACGGNCVVIDFGAGDQFFDNMLLDRCPSFRTAAVDIGYTPETLKKIKDRVRHPEQIGTVNTLAELGKAQADFAVCLDSLEYVENDAACLTEIASHVKPGGFIVLTLPAFRFLFSEFDLIVRGLRRYDKKDIRRLIGAVPQLEPERIHCFYTLLFLIRFLQKYLPIKIDPEKKVISGWPYGYRHILTKAVMAVLAADYRVNAFLGRFRLDLPGLSVLAICRKREEDAPRD